MDYVKLAKVADFEGISIKSYRILGKFVAIVKEPDGSFYATEIGCKHNNADLTQGRFRGDEVVCPRHGWKYNIKTGACLTHPSAPLRRHALKIEGDAIYVSTTALEPGEPFEDDDAMPEIRFRSSD